MKYYLPITLLMLTMTSGLSVAADPPAQVPKQTPWEPPVQVAPANKAKQNITTKATVLEVDWKQLAESKDGFTRIIRAFVTDTKSHNKHKPHTQNQSFHSVAVPQSSTDGIIRLLMDSNAIKLLGKSQLNTLAGMPEDITLDSKTPFAASIEIRNGKQHGETKFHHIGTNLKLTPQVLSDGGINLAVTVEHCQQLGKTGEYITADISGPIVQLRKLNFVAALKEGQSIILSETGPPEVKEKNQSVKKGLIIILSPSIDSATPTADSATSTAHRTPAIYQTPAKFEDATNAVRHNRTPQLANSAPRPVQQATFVPQQKSQDLHQSVRELRSDVRTLRRDVGQLLKILEGKEKNGEELSGSDMTTSERKLHQALRLHQDLKKGISLKTENMPLVDVLQTIQQSEGINIYVDSRGLKEEGLTSQTPISIEVKGIILKSVLNLMLEPLNLAYHVRNNVLVITSKTRAKKMEKDALLGIVDKDAPHRTATWKGSSQSSVTPVEHKIYQALKNGVSLKTENMPLADVMRTLSQKVGINIVIDSRGLEEEGIDSQTPMSFEVNKIRLKSVLNLLLEPMNLGYQVRDEVLVITSKTRTRGKLSVSTYPVADLAIPTPLAGPVPSHEKKPSASSPSIDPDSLIDIIQSTVDPDSWENIGGAGSIRFHDSTLSLVIRQTSQVHQKIEKLLIQLRQMQDLQIMVESHFLDNLPKDIWNQVGIDFDSKQDVAKKNAKGKQRDNGPLGGIILTNEQAALLLQVARNNDLTNLIQTPNVTLFNGQTAGIKKFMVGGKQHPSLHMQPVISADRSNVRLNLLVSDQESSSSETWSYVNTVPYGKTVLIELLQRDKKKTEEPSSVKVSNASQALKNTGAHQSKGRRFLLIRPHFIVQEEEEEALFSGSRS